MFDFKRLHLLSPVQMGSEYVYVTPDTTEEVESDNYFLRANDRLRKFDNLKITADCNSNRPAFCEARVEIAEREHVKIWKVFDWKRPPEPKVEVSVEDKEVKIVEAISSLKPDDFTNAGLPNRLKLSHKLGFQISPEELESAWSVYNDRKLRVANGE